VFHYFPPELHRALQRQSRSPLVSPRASGCPSDPNGSSILSAVRKSASLISSRRSMRIPNGHDKHRRFLESHFTFSFDLPPADVPHVKSSSETAQFGPPTGPGRSTDRPQSAGQGQLRAADRGANSGKQLRTMHHRKRKVGQAVKAVCRPNYRKVDIFDTFTLGPSAERHPCCPRVWRTRTELHPLRAEGPNNRWIKPWLTFGSRQLVLLPPQDQILL
jgi:hypothetical protein